MRTLLSLLVVVSAAACGDDGVNRLPDAPPLPPDAGELEPVTLTITDGDEPRAGVTVLFQNADSSLVERAVTNSEGVASARMAAGGFVTAVDPFASPVLPELGGSGGGGRYPDDLRTFAGVKPGDALKLSRDGGSSYITVNVVVPIAPNAASYYLWTTCGQGDVSGGGGSGSGGSGSGSPGGSFELVNCGATMDAVLTTRGFGGELQSSLAKTNLAVEDGMNVDFTDGEYQDVQQLALAYTNIPDGITVLDMRYQQLTARGALFDSFTAADVTANAVSVTLARPAVPGATSLLATTFYNGGRSRHGVADWGQIDTYEFNVANTLLEEISTFPQFDAATGTYSWTASAGAKPDFSISSTYVARDDQKTSFGWRWELVAPYAESRISFPVLPGDEAELNPRASDQVYLDDLILIKAPGGYDAVRETALTPSPLPPFAGRTGRLVVQMLAFNDTLTRRAAPHQPSANFLPAPVRRVRAR